MATEAAPAPAAAPRTKISGKKASQKIPESLVRETINGVNFYYPGFREVMNKTKTIEDIMPESTFQSSLKTELGFLLKKNLDVQKFRVLVGETGLHMGKSNNVGLDVAVFQKEVLPKEKVNFKFANVPAELVIEVDVDIELEDNSKNTFLEFVLPKTERLLEFGTKKVVWIFTQPRRIFVATPTGFRTLEWSQPVELMPGVILELEKLLTEAEIQ